MSTSTAQWSGKSAPVGAAACVGPEQISLAFQFVASFFWMIGAALAGPEGASDFLQLFAAVAWCIANFSSAYSMLRPKGAKGPAAEENVICRTAVSA